MEWILIFWLGLDRGGGPATAEFTTKERCEAAGRQIFETTRYKQYSSATYNLAQGNFICVPK
jgi:hypothetical protein